MKPQIERLESRLEMTGTITLSAGVLTIVGEAGSAKNTVDVFAPAPGLVAVHYQDGDSEVTDVFPLPDVQSIDDTGNARFNDIFNYTDINERAVGTTGFNEFLTFGSGSNTWLGSDDCNVFVDYGHGKTDATLGTGSNYVIGSAGSTSVHSAGGRDFIWLF